MLSEVKRKITESVEGRVESRDKREGMKGNKKKKGGETHRIPIKFT